MVGALRRPGHLRDGRRGRAQQRRDAAEERRRQHAGAGEAVRLDRRARQRGGKPKGAKVTLRRAGKVKGKLVAWACPATVTEGATPPPCSAKVTLRKKATLKLPASLAGKVRVTVVRGRS